MGKPKARCLPFFQQYDRENQTRCALENKHRQQCQAEWGKPRIKTHICALLMDSHLNQEQYFSYQLAACQLVS